MLVFITDEELDILTHSARDDKLPLYGVTDGGAWIENEKTRREAGKNKHSVEEICTV